MLSAEDLLDEVSRADHGLPYQFCDAGLMLSSIRCRKAQKTLETVEQPPDPVFQQVDKELTRHQWFHGMMPRSDCEEMLKDEGDFLVRKTTVAKATTYCISVRHGGETKHIPIAYDKGIWSLLEDSKPTLAELIDLLVEQKKRIPPSNSVLIKSMARPDYFFLHEDITLGERLGHRERPELLDGAFGEVYAGKLKLKGGEEVDVAIKRSKAGHMKKAQLTAFVREARIMRRLGHPNIVRLYGVAAQEEPVMIILELATNGSLKAFYKKNEDVSVNQKLGFAKDACRGMCYLSGAKVIHRDLAARNCLLGSKNEVKISDFGLSVMNKSEIRLNKLHKVPGVFTTKTDVWSFGVLMWEIFANCRSDPFPGVNNAQAIELITGKTPPMLPPEGSPDVLPNERADFATVFRVLAPSEALPASVKLSVLALGDSKSAKEPT
ncbi:SH2 domain protein [Ancylostoma ceylanicum]|uniref:Tyrosine-protein kinase n=1 Tax=Ancylostoma ceylanicum TaxID=53326 RepID=A0A0D6L6C1_9BILA|nr:SH2 domain protein [Ancylostoma ceylanicum]